MGSQKRKKSIFVVCAILITMVISPAGIYAAVSVQANPTNSSVLVDGTAIAFDAYNISNNNYFKLRDIAKALSGSADQYNVTWDGTTNSIDLITGRGYVPVGGELSIAAVKSAKNALLSTSKVRVNGVLVSLTAYNIDGYNYFKLRDLGSALNFGVSFNAASNSVLIDTKSTGSSGYISITEAESIALNHAKLSRASVTGLVTQFETDEGYPKYEVKFIYSGREYEYKINAETGVIVEAENNN